MRYQSKLKPNSKSTLSLILKISSIICLILAIACFSYEPLKSHLVNHYHLRITRQTVAQGSRDHQGDYQMSQVKPVSINQVVNARMHAKHLPVVGQMLVPSVGLHLPIGKGISSQILMLAAGTMKAHEKMGHGSYSMAGHHMINKSAFLHRYGFMLIKAL